MEPTNLPSEDKLWQWVVDRAAPATKQFYYSVRTTGIYCRPGCPSRRPKRSNVTFFFSCEAAEQASFRACKRCHPKNRSVAEQQAQAVTAACRLIEQSEEEPDLDALARVAGLSRYHFHRVFKSLTGITPKAYAQARREGRLREQLPGAQSITAAFYSAGFNSSGRFYERAQNALGMTPSEFRRGAPSSTIRFAVGDCSLGCIAVAATDKGVCAVLFGDDPAALVDDVTRRFAKAELIGDDENFKTLVAAVIASVETPGQASELPLDVKSTAFQEQVWRRLRQIPAGSTASYGEIAASLGRPSATRAVAQACGANPVAVIIPCHRVVRKDGSPSGYRWGLERKETLLKREAGGSRDRTPKT